MTLVTCDAWTAWQERLAEASVSRHRLQDELLLIAEQMRQRLSPNSSLAAMWRPLGIHVAAAALPTSGTCSVVDGRRIVLVSDSDGPKRQRFTVAHEVGHLLLSGVPGFAGECSGRSEEEKLCDTFARAVLIPRVGLLRHLATHGFPQSPLPLLRLCSAFDVNLQPMLLALAELNHRDGGNLALLARRRGHPQRLDEVDFRVDAVVGPSPFFIPRDQRLVSLGLTQLVAWANSATAPASGQGRDEEAQIKIWDRGQKRAGYANGSVTWEAQLVGGTSACIVAYVAIQNLAHVWE